MSDATVLHRNHTSQDTGIATNGDTAVGKAHTQITQRDLHVHGDQVHGDKINGDKVDGDKVLGDKHVHAADEAYDVRGLPNPYLGLSAFTYRDRGCYAGRDDTIAQAVRLVTAPGEQRSLLFITGASGSGKSSFAQAGLLPALETYYQHWPVRWAVFRPSRQPLAGLAEALLQLGLAAEGPFADAGNYMLGTAAEPTPANQISLLVIDQFEELFTQSVPDQRDRLFQMLESLPPFAQLRIHVIATLRIDYLPELYTRKTLYDFAKRGIDLRSMRINELKRAIQRPLQQAYPKSQKRFEAALLKRLAADTAENAAYLPLLQVTLEDLWSRGSLHSGEYSGLTDAIQQRAEEIYAHTVDAQGQQITRPPAEQEALLNIFLDLVEVSLDNDLHRDVRRRRPVRDLIQGNAVSLQLIEELVENRLLSKDLEVLPGSGEEIEVVDIIHESLIVNWQRLQNAIAEKRDLLQQRTRFEYALAEWSSQARGDAYLLRGVRLAEAESLDLHGDVAVQNRDARQLLKRSIKRREARRRRSRRIAIGVIITLAVFLFAAIGAAGFALDARDEAQAEAATRAAEVIQRSTAEAVAIEEKQNAQSAATRAAIALNGEAEQRRIAQRQSKIARARQLAAESLNVLATDPEHAIRLALKALSTTSELAEPVLPDALDALHRATQAARLQRMMNAHGGRMIHDVSYSPEGRYLTSAGTDGVVGIWEVETGAPPSTLPRGAQSSPVLGAKIDADGSYLYLTDVAGNLEVWELATKQILPGYPRSLHNGQPIIDSDLAADGSLFATTGADAYTRVLDLTTREVVQEIPLDHSGCGVALNSDGSQVATGDLHGNIYIWNLASAEETYRYTHTGEPNAVCAVDFSADNNILATGGADMAVQLWSVSTQTTLSTLSRHTDTVYRVRFSPDGALLASASLDNKVNIYDVSSGKLLKTLAGHTGGLRGMAFAPDGSQLATADEAGEIRLWDVTFGYHSDVITKILYGPDGSFFASSSTDGNVKIWDAESERLLQQIYMDGQIWDIDVHPTQSIIAAVSSADRVAIWNVASNERMAEFETRASSGGSIAYSPTGRMLAVAGDDGVLLWDTQSQNRIEFYETPQRNYSVAFSPDEKSVATVTADRTVRMWNLHTGELRFTVTHAPDNAEIKSMAFSPEGDMLATADVAGTVAFWDATTGDMLAAIPGHTRIIYEVIFSRDGKLLATASGDPSVKIWDVAAAIEQSQITSTMFEFRDFSLHVTSADFSPDGKKIIAASADQVIRRYTLSLDELVEEAEERLRARSVNPQ